MSIRTQEEIIARIESLRGADFLGFRANDLINALDYEHAKPYLRESVAAEQWNYMPRDRNWYIAQMLDYMPFAWEKANNGRGISAARSLGHYEAWLWLIDVDLNVDPCHYQFYGKDELRRICEHFGWDADQWDNGERTNG